MITAWRITKEKHLRSAFTGEGARLYGGRWNSPGTAMIYAAGSQSLAVLEMLVHLDATGLLQSYVLVPVEIGDDLIANVDGILPENWNEDPAPGETRRIGDEWTNSLYSPVLRVPSVLVPTEYNYLLNPKHSGWEELKIGEPVRYRFDPRLMKKER